MTWTITISFAGALLAALLPKDKPVLARWFALAVAVAGLALAVAGYAAGFGQGRQVFVDALWVPSMGIHFLLAADGFLSLAIADAKRRDLAHCLREAMKCSWVAH